MSEREPDDTTNSPPAPQPDRARREPGDYYYDDATGYEIYKPGEDEGNGDEETER